MPAPASGLQSISDLTTTSRITSGDIPPPLVGATMTVVDDKLYLFGGRLIKNRQMTNSLYVLNLGDFHWQNVTDAVNVAPTRAIGDPGAEDENEMAAAPKERYFHSANTYKNMLVFFGGMGPSSNAPVAEGQQVDLIVYDDINVLDLELMQWKLVRIPTSTNAPKPRYAHLSSISGNKLVIVGGQDINNQYIEEVNVLDLDSWQWVTSIPFEKHCGSYRSIAVSGSGQSSSVPVIGSEAEIGSPTLSPTSDVFPTSYLHKTPSNSSLHYTPSLRKSPSNMVASKKNAVSRLSGGSSAAFSTSPPSTVSDQRSSMHRLSQFMTQAPVQKEEHPVYIYSNFNFTDVKRELQVLSPPLFQMQDHSQSMTGNLLPPGLRFPTGAITGQHLLLSGTYLTNTQQSFSIWSLNLSSLVWTRIDTGTVFSTGSWNRGLLLEGSNEYIVFGNKSRSLADDYQNRQTNFEHVTIVDLEAFGIYQHPPTTMTQTAQELGLSLLNDPALSDFEILTQDQQRIPINSAILASRWPYFGALLREQEEHDIARCKAENIEYDPTASTKRTLALPEPYAVVLAFLQYLYTDHLITAQQHHPQVLSQLLLLADMYGLDRLRDLATHALHQMLNMSTAAMVYETAALSQQTGLQIRSLKVMIAAKKMLQQQQLKLQQQQALSQSISANQAWHSSELGHMGAGGGGHGENSHHQLQLQQQRMMQQHHQQQMQMQQQQIQMQYNPYLNSQPLPYMSQQQNIHGIFQPSPPPLSPTSINAPPASPDYHRLSIQSSTTALPHPMVRNRASLIGNMPPQHWNTEPLTPPPVSPPPPTSSAPQTPAPNSKSSFFSFPGSRNKDKEKAAAAAAVASSGASTRSGSSTMASGTATSSNPGMMPGGPGSSSSHVLGHNSSGSGSSGKPKGNNDSIRGGSSPALFGNMDGPVMLGAMYSDTSSVKSGKSGMSTGSGSERGLGSSGKNSKKVTEDQIQEMIQRVIDKNFALGMGVIGGR